MNRCAVKSYNKLYGKPESDNTIIIRFGNMMFTRINRTKFLLVANSSFFCLDDRKTAAKITVRIAAATYHLNSRLMAREINGAKKYATAK